MGRMMQDSDRFSQRPMMNAEERAAEDYYNRLRGLMPDGDPVAQFAALQDVMTSILNSMAAFATNTQIAALQGQINALGTTLVTLQNAVKVPVVRKATVANGNAVFQFTTDQTAGGASVFPGGIVADCEQFRAEEGTNPHAFGVAAWSNGGKTLTVPVSRNGATVSVLGLTVLGANIAANGSVVYATVWGKTTQ